jgi:hypothetical protein
MKQTVKKTFDALAYKRDLQAAMYEETKHLSAPELIAYFRERSRAGALGDSWETLQPQPLHSAATVEVDVE